MGAKAHPNHLLYRHKGAHGQSKKVANTYSAEKPPAGFGPGTELAERFLRDWADSDPIPTRGWSLGLSLMRPTRRQGYARPDNRASLEATVSLPVFSTQAELFSTAGLSSSLFAATDRYRLFAQVIYPAVAAMRGELEKGYCADNGRVAIEPVLLMGTSLLQYLDGLPDRQALEMLRYHAGWTFALNRQLGDQLFHPTTLSNFRHRLLENNQSALGFQKVLDALVEAGLVSRKSRQRLDSTQMFGLVSRMSRLDCVRESLRLALQELEGGTRPQARPGIWGTLWERYVESQVDYRAGSDTLKRKLAEAGSDVWQLLEWLGRPEQAKLAAGTQVQLLKRVFGEQFDLIAGQAAPLPKEKVVVKEETSMASEPRETVVSAVASPAAPSQARPSEAVVTPGAVSNGQSELSAPAADAAVQIEPKGKKELHSDRVQNPHDPDATYAVKGQGEKKKEHVGYKVQVAETVGEVTLAPGEPTRNFIAGIVTHPAYESDDAGAEKIEQEQAQMGIEKPPVQYVDAAYVSAEKLMRAEAEGRELIGPARPATEKDGRFNATAFQVQVEERRAVCPAGKVSTQCSRLKEESTGKVSYRFEWSTHCHDCPLRSQCLGKEQRHRTLLVGEHHTMLQARRQEQGTEAFQQRMKHRNAIEGTQSELVRAHGIRQARYRGLAKVRLQNYFAGMACNVKRWINRKAWEILQAEAATVPAAG
jgi:transposase